jgi:hypothetical protein
LKAVEELGNGKVLIGGVGSGKTPTSLAYFWVREMGGVLNDFTSVKIPMDIYIFTTARKRDSHDWQYWASQMMINEDRENSVFKIRLVVESYNNMPKYEGISGCFVIFDEQRVVGSGAWSKSFIKIAKNNRWIMLSATPGDVWEDYIPLFIANGYYKNRTEFKRRHCVYSYYGRFPKLERYIEKNPIIRLRNSILVDMPYEKHTTRYEHEVPVEYDKDLFEKVVKKRWHVYEDRPLRDVSELFSVMRKVVNSDQSRLQAVEGLLKKHPRLIVFYNFDYELEMLRTLSDQQGMTMLNPEISFGPETGKPSNPESPFVKPTDLSERQSSGTALRRPQSPSGKRSTVSTYIGLPINPATPQSPSRSLSTANPQKVSGSTRTTPAQSYPGLRQSASPDSLSSPKATTRQSTSPLRSGKSPAQPLFTSHPDVTEPKTLPKAFDEDSNRPVEEKPFPKPRSSPLTSSTEKAHPQKVSGVGSTVSTSIFPETSSSNTDPSKPSQSKISNEPTEWQTTLKRQSNAPSLHISESQQVAENSSGPIPILEDGGDPWVGTIWAKDYIPKPGRPDPRMSVKNIKAKGDFERWAKKNDRKEKLWQNRSTSQPGNGTSTSTPSPSPMTSKLGDGKSSEQLIGSRDSEALEPDHIQDQSSSSPMEPPSPSSIPSHLDGLGEPTLAEWNGHKHEDVPTTDRWVYLVQYVAGAEAWNCTSTNAIAFWSLTYSYKNFEQAKGRIDRLDTPFFDLHYYILLSKSPIDKGVARSLKQKRNFNEREFLATG